MHAKVRTQYDDPGKISSGEEIRQELHTVGNVPFKLIFYTPLKFIRGYVYPSLTIPVCCNQTG